MRESVDIVYGGIELSKHNGIQINDDGGLFLETFVANKSIREEKIRGRDEPYFFGVEREPISFPLSFYFDETLSDERKREIARLLDHDYYKPLYAADNPQRIYYAMCVDNSQHIHNGIQMGYVTLNFRTTSPFAFSPVYFKEFDFSDNSESGTEFLFENNGDIDCKPVVEIVVLEDGDISILNYSNGGQEFKFTNLASGERLTIDCIEEEIISNIDERYDNFSDSYLTFAPYNRNHLKAYGKFLMKMTYQYKFK